MKSKNGLITIVMLTALIFSSSQTTFAEIRKVEIGIDGLSCPFCVWGLKKQMERIKAIESFKVSLKKSVANIMLKENSRLNIEDYKDAVKKAGFSIRKIKILADGEIEANGDFLALRVSGTGQLFILDNAEKLQEGRRVSIKGIVHEHTKGEPYGLSIEKVELIKE